MGCAALSGARHRLSGEHPGRQAAGPAPAEREGIGIVSLGPRAIRGLFVRMYLSCSGKLDTFRGGTAWRGVVWGVVHRHHELSWSCSV